jgi:hypothetical protein
MENSGANNTGHLNSGANNTGWGNSGSQNTGALNSGNTNTGPLNSGNFNTGIGNSGNVDTGAFIRGSDDNGFFWRGDLEGVLRGAYYINIHPTASVTIGVVGSYSVVGASGSIGPASFTIPIDFGSHTFTVFNLTPAPGVSFGSIDKTLIQPNTSGFFNYGTGASGFLNGFPGGIAGGSDNTSGFFNNVLAKGSVGNVSGFINGRTLHPGTSISGLENTGADVSGILNFGGSFDSGSGNLGSDLSGFANGFAAKIAAAKALIAKIQAVLKHL